MKIRMTQKILYDKRYYQSLMIYKKFLKEYKVEINNEKYVEYENSYNYIFIIADLINQVMIAQGLYEYNIYLDKDCIDSKVVSVENIVKAFDEGSQMSIKGRHIATKKLLEYSMILNNRLDDKNAHIELMINYGNKVDVTKFIVNSEFREKGMLLEEIDSIMNKFYMENVDTRVIINTITLPKIKYRTIDERLKGTFRLSNLGNNFLTQEEYKKYGNYKMAMMPINVEVIQDVYYKILSLVRMKFLQLGMFEKCTFCGIGELKHEEGGLKVCSHCKKRVAINKCKKCGKEKIKFLSKNSNEIAIDKNLEITEYHREYEIKSVTLGACYEQPYSNSGGFCSNCGYCDSSNKNCIRCTVLENN